MRSWVRGVAPGSFDGLLCSWFRSLRPASKVSVSVLDRVATLYFGDEWTQESCLFAKLIQNTRNLELCHTLQVFHDSLCCLWRTCLDEVVHVATNTNMGQPESVWSSEESCPKFHQCELPMQRGLLWDLEEPCERLSVLLAEELSVKCHSCVSTTAKPCQDPSHARLPWRMTHHFLTQGAYRGWHLMLNWHSIVWHKQYKKKLNNLRNIHPLT